MGTAGCRARQTVSLVMGWSLVMFPVLVTLPPDVTAELSPHAPIIIDGLADFTAANGVAAGSGAQDDPFIIAGWDINASASHGIVVRDTTAHFLIRDVRVHSGGTQLDGIRLENVTNGRAQQLNLTGNRDGIVVENSTAVWVSSSTFDSNAGAGLRVRSSGDWQLFQSEYVANSHGIIIEGSSDALVFGNEFERNTLAAVIAFGSSDVYVVGNWVAGNPTGVRFSGTRRVLISNNVFAQSVAVGVDLINVTGGTVVRNRFESNQLDAGDDRGVDNSWDGGYPLGGNSWDRYSGPDECSGPNQTVCPDADGIGDIPFDIDADSADRYPLYSWSAPDLQYPITVLAVGEPNVTAVGGYLVTSATPLSLSVFSPYFAPIASTTYALDGGSWRPYEGPFTLSGEGVHKVEFRSEDIYLNVEPIRYAWVAVDDSPPWSVETLRGYRYDALGKTWITSSTRVNLTMEDSDPPSSNSTGGQVLALNLTLLVSQDNVTADPTGNITFLDILLRANATVPLELPPGIYEASVHLTGSLCPDIDLGVFYDGNGDGLWNASEIVGFDADSDSDEIVFLEGPASGDYLIVVLGFSVPATGCIARLTVVEVFGVPPASGAALLEYRVWTGGWTPWAEYIEPFNITREGEAFVEFRGIDAIGNMEATNNRTVYVDNAPPRSAAVITGNGRRNPAVELSSNDAGCGVRTLFYRIDNEENWTAIRGSERLTFTDTGVHTVEFYGVDYLNHVEPARVAVVEVTDKAPPATTTNWKPLVALVFATVLAAVGILATRGDRIPDLARRRIRLGLTLPLAGLEVATGMVSLLTGALAIPPVLGLGALVDLAILAGGLVLPAVASWRARQPPVLPRPLR